jgi:hypothetical protein
MLKTANLPELLVKANKFPERTILFVANAHLFLRKEDVLQGVWNLRDTFKANGRTLVLLGALSMSLPAELAQDVLMLDELRPSLEELSNIVRAQFGDADAGPPDEKTLNRAVDAVCGLAAFPAEQCVAMSFVRREGRIELDTDALWERKRKMIENVKGLSVWRGRETFADIGGVENAKSFLTEIMNGAEPPRIIVLLDEFEKAMAGGEGTDASGTAEEMHGTLLTEMNDQNYAGLIYIGIAGSCKSYLVQFGSHLRRSGDRDEHFRHEGEICRQLEREPASGARGDPRDQPGPRVVYRDMQRAGEHLRTAEAPLQPRHLDVRSADARRARSDLADPSEALEALGPAV